MSIFVVFCVGFVVTALVFLAICLISGLAWITDTVKGVGFGEFTAWVGFVMATIGFGVCMTYILIEKGVI